MELCCLVVRNKIQEAPFHLIQLYTKQQNFRIVQLIAIADDNINGPQELEFELGRIENIVGKGENAGTSIFSFSCNVFKSILFQGL